jgi:hypothetical protein
MDTDKNRSKKVAKKTGIAQGVKKALLEICVHLSSSVAFSSLVNGDGQI